MRFSPSQSKHLDEEGHSQYYMKRVVQSFMYHSDKQGTCLRRHVHIFIIFLSLSLYRPTISGSEGALIPVVVLLWSLLCRQRPSLRISSGHGFHLIPIVLNLNGPNPTVLVQIQNLSIRSLVDRKSIKSLKNIII